MRFHFEIRFLSNSYFPLITFIRDFIHDICFILIRNLLHKFCESTSKSLYYYSIESVSSFVKKRF